MLPLENRRTSMKNSRTSKNEETHVMPQDLLQPQMYGRKLFRQGELNWPSLCNNILKQKMNYAVFSTPLPPSKH